MGQAFDRNGNVLGEAYGATKADVFQELNSQFNDAHEIRIKKLDDRLKAEEVHDLARVANIAAVCHEANRAYCLTVGDASQPTWSEAPDWQRQSAMTGVRGILDGSITRPEQSHISWLAEKVRDGWKYGPVKNPETKEHPCFVPYDQLPADQQKKDALFFAIVNALKA